MSGNIFFVSQRQKKSSHMAQITEHINSSKRKINSYDQMSKKIFNLGSKKYKNKNKFTCQLRRLHNSLLMSIVDTPEKDLSNIYRKFYDVDTVDIGYN